MSFGTEALLLACLIASAEAASGKPGFFPSEVVAAGGGWHFPNKLGEPRFWTKKALRGYRQRIRMFIGGHTRKSWMIAIDERRNGSARLRFGEYDRGGALIEERRVPISRGQAAQVIELAAKAGLWTTHPQFFVYADEDDTVCIDGMTLILERVDASGYRYAEANAQCTAGPPQIAVASKMLELAKKPELQRLLR